MYRQLYTSDNDQINCHTFQILVCPNKDASSSFTHCLVDSRNSDGYAVLQDTVGENFQLDTETKLRAGDRVLVKLYQGVQSGDVTVYEPVSASIRRSEFGQAEYDYAEKTITLDADGSYIEFLPLPSLGMLPRINLLCGRLRAFNPLSNGIEPDKSVEDLMGFVSASLTSIIKEISEANVEQEDNAKQFTSEYQDKHSRSFVLTGTKLRDKSEIAKGLGLGLQRVLDMHNEYKQSIISECLGAKTNNETRKLFEGLMYDTAAEIEQVFGVMPSAERLYINQGKKETKGKQADSIPRASWSCSLSGDPEIMKPALERVKWQTRNMPASVQAKALHDKREKMWNDSFYNPALVETSRKVAKVKNTTAIEPMAYASIGVEVQGMTGAKTQQSQGVTEGAIAKTIKTPTEIIARQGKSSDNKVIKGIAGGLAVANGGSTVLSEEAVDGISAEIIKKPKGFVKS